MVGATLGLLAFLLAFTFGVASSRFDSRTQMVLEESNAIGTTYLRAGLLPEYRDEIRSLLRSYVDSRLEAVRTGDAAPAMKHSLQVHDELWPYAEKLSAKHPNSIAVGVFVQSLNEMIDSYSKRVAIALRSRIPASIWIGLYAVATLALGSMGYHGGVSGTTRSLAVVAVAIAFSIVLWLVADLDRPYEGSIQVNQRPMIELRQSMGP
jgi:hypothetical protein